MDEHKPKINIIIGSMLVCYVAVLDLIGVILIFFGLDDFFILDAMSSPVTLFYFRLKKVRGSYDVIASVGELLPYVGALPIKTTGVIFVLWVDRHPNSFLAKKAAAVSGSLKGKFGQATSGLSGNDNVAHAIIKK